MEIDLRAFVLAVVVVGTIVVLALCEWVADRRRRDDAIRHHKAVRDMGPPDYERLWKR